MIVINKCEILERMLESLYDWNFNTFAISDIYKTLGLVETNLAQSDIFLINEVIWDLVVERVITPGPINDFKGQTFLITSQEKVKERLAVCRL